MKKHKWEEKYVDLHEMLGCGIKCIFTILKGAHPSMETGIMLFDV
jgi:hypothetical protein